MKFIELHLSDGGMITINVNTIVNFIEQKSGGTYINFVNGPSKTVKEDYFKVQDLVGINSEESVYNNLDVNEEFVC